MKKIATYLFLLLSFTTYGVGQDSFPPLVDPGVNGGQLDFSVQPERFTPLENPEVQDPSGTAVGQASSGQNSNVLPVPEIPGGFPQAINEPMMDWMDWSEWDASVELGINGSSGNSDSFNVSSGFDVKRTDEQTETSIGLKYVNNKSDDVLVAHNARLNLDWEKKFGTDLGDRWEPSRWSWFVKNTYYFDEFRPFDYRVAINTGLGYKFFETEVQMLKGRAGLGTSREFGGPSDEWVPEALFGLDYRRKLSKRQNLELKADYFPSWENFSDYRFVGDCSWVYLLDAETNLSLKLNVNNQYDSTPDGASANDIFYSLLLLWKF